MHGKQSGPIIQFSILHASLVFLLQNTCDISLRISGNETIFIQHSLLPRDFNVENYNRTIFQELTKHPSCQSMTPTMFFPFLLAILTEACHPPLPISHFSQCPYKISNRRASGVISQYTYNCQCNPVLSKVLHAKTLNWTLKVLMAS